MDRNEAIALWRSTLPGHNIIDEWVITAILAAYKQAIEDAIKAVPSETSGWPVEVEIGWNDCRAEMLRRLEELK